jgi:diguanylate cyclase (GGDEF)-like protein
MSKDEETLEGIDCRDEAVGMGSDQCDSLYDKEIRFIKGLQAIIGEMEGRTLVCNYSYDALDNFVKFNTLGLLVCANDTIEICLCTGGSTSQAEIDFMQAILTARLPDSFTETRQSRTIVLGEMGDRFFDPAAVSTIGAPLGKQEDRMRFAAILRQGSAFSKQEESTFRRLCSHVALTLEKIELFDRVTELAITDGLTGISNHLHIVTKLEREIARSKRYGSNLSVILFDIDNFKDVNDRFGHLAGDQVLIGVAQLLKNSVRTADAVGRYGGEEFLVVLPETDGEATLMMAERVRSRIQDEEFIYEDQVIKLTLSGGVAGYRGEIQANKLIKIADENLLAAKKLGKNVVIYEEG